MSQNVPATPSSGQIGVAPGDKNGALLSQQAYQYIEEAIVTLRYDPGSVLSEAQISRELGFGRTPVREALQRLSQEGLVVVLPKRGVLVSDINPSSQLRLLEVRRVLERLMASLACERATPEETARFDELGRQFRSVVDASHEIEFMRTDRELNRLIAQASHNEFCERMMRLTHGLSRRFFFRHRASADLVTTAANHADLAEAIARGDSKAAKAAVDQLIDHNEQFTLDSLRR